MGILVTHLSARFDRNDLERLRDAKRSRNFYRLRSSKAVEHEFRGPFGQPSSYAFVRFECAPANDLSFQVRASWPSTVSEGEQTHVELGIAEAVADILLEGVYQHSGCAIVLVDVRWDYVGGSVAAFMRATKSAMQQLLAGDWEIVLRSEKQSSHESQLT
jgi:hypothetical protein